MENFQVNFCLFQSFRCLKYNFLIYFQKEKQKKLNDLDIVVTLNFNQLQLTEKGYLPSDLSEALVFDSRNLERLQSRIKELQTEKLTEKKTFKYIYNKKFIGFI